MVPRHLALRAARPTARAGALALAVGLPLLLAVPAFADTIVHDSGEVHGHGLGIVTTLLVFIGIPLAILVVVSALTLVPRLRHRPRYRPGRPWTFDPVWFGGPAEPDAAIALARPVRGTGGASGEW